MREATGRIILDFPRPGSQPLRLAGVPERVIVAESVAEVRPSLKDVEEAARSGYYAVGYISYEAAPAFDPAMEVRENPRMPLLWFGLLSPEALGARLTPAAEARSPDAEFRFGPWAAGTTRDHYDEAIGLVHDAIGRGDTYQANYTLRLQARFDGDELALFQRLRAAQQPSYSAYLNLGRYRVLSVSPELFFHWRDGALTTRPMKGTIRRGMTLAEDQLLAARLAESAKERAENVMIVDLLRNDLGRIAEFGSVRVPHLFEIERYPTLFQMTSTVTARARPGLTLEDLFGALFPCGSITGAPKISTMRLLRQLESTPREVYCGAVGVICPDGEALFNVAIRTLWLDTEAGTAEYGTGGGITWDSVAISEYEEALTKAAVLTEPRPEFDLLETMRLENGDYLLLHRHLDRLAESAAYFDYPCDPASIEEHLAGLEEELSTACPEGADAFRVRVRLARDGTVTLEAMSLTQPFGLPPRNANHATGPRDSDHWPLPTVNCQLSTAPTSRQNRFLYHKTTHRAVYEQARAAHPEAWEVLLWNEAGELMEFTIGNVVLELGGEWLTPPLSSGLLAGTYRAELLEQGVIHERVLVLADLEKATRVWLINSVRGWVEVQLGRA